MAEKEAEAPAESPPAAAPSGGKKKILLIAGLVLFLVLAAGVPAAIFMLKGKEKVEQLGADAADGDEPARLEGAGEDLELEEGEEPLGAILPMDTFVVNLRGSRYIRTQVQLEFMELDIPAKFHRKIVPVRDAIISLLVKQNPEELLTEKGREKLRIDIKDAVNSEIRKVVIKNVYFTQFVIQ
jgi:flagellar protein FliL